MELCSIGHDEVCYESRFCPACTVREDLEEKIQELEENNAQLADENRKLEKDCEEYQGIIDAEKEDGR